MKDFRETSNTELALEIVFNAGRLAEVIKHYGDIGFADAGLAKTAALEAAKRLLGTEDAGPVGPLVAVSNPDGSMDVVRAPHES